MNHQQTTPPTQPGCMCLLTKKAVCGKYVTPFQVSIHLKREFWATQVFALPWDLWEFIFFIAWSGHNCFLQWRSLIMKNRWILVPFVPDVTYDYEAERDVCISLQGHLMHFKHKIDESTHHQNSSSRWSPNFILFNFAFETYEFFRFEVNLNLSD